MLEKAREAGAHSLSGALLDPSTLKDLIPDFEAKGAPLATPVHEDNIYFLTESSKLRLPITPPPFVNHGNYIISLNQFTKWLGAQVEAEGIDLFMGFAAQHPLYDGTRVIGVRTGDRGVGKDGKPKAAYEPGADIHAKVTIFADGVRGHLTKQLIRDLQLGAESEPPTFAIGLKELWDVPEGSPEAGHRHSHARLSAARGRVRRQLALRDARGPHLDRLRRRARLQGSAVRSARGLPAFQAASLHQRAFSRAGK